MKNMKVRTKLITGFMIVTLLAIILAGVGIFSSVSIKSACPPGAICSIMSVFRLARAAY